MFWDFNQNLSFGEAKLSSVHIFKMLVEGCAGKNITIIKDYSGP